MAGGGARARSGPAKGSKHLRVTARQHNILRAAEKLAAEIVANRPVRGHKLGKDILSLYSNQVAAICQKFAPRLGKDGEPVWPFAGAEEKYLTWLREVRAFAAAVAPFESPQYRAVVVADAARPGNGAKEIQLRIFDSEGKLVRPLIDEAASPAPANRPPADVRPWPRPVPDNELAPDEPDPRTPPTWRRPGG
jgi:hypothetical protein